MNKTQTMDMTLIIEFVQKKRISGSDFDMYMGVHYSRIALIAYQNNSNSKAKGISVSK